MSGKDHIQAPQDDDDKINRTLRENLPENINEVDLGAKDQKGLLSFIGDPLGKGVQKVVSPVGNLVGGTGDRMAGFTKQDEKQKSGGESYEKFGGKEQNAGNPLGL
ncbi:hypothetical protein M436DRAFT_60041 [Aureobasidium namibiae CBS 147.97]|uniref:Uncharacterized protein n=1 Tax=Aureobasidium namibiae CBS 147.97 TaxID=1043004 RepID=A0A074X7X7_9PEZI